MRQLAQRVDSLARIVAPEHYAAWVQEVSSVIGLESATGTQLEPALPPDEYWQLRLTMQDAVIDEMRRAWGFAIASIRDDIDQRLAIPIPLSTLDC
jgi:hypothetical protein